jgi:flagellar hook assembly protein FlgD
LGIYNLRGECVRSFEATFIGEYEFEWDGCDQRGRRMPSGIYLLRLKSGRLAQTRKIVFK